MMKSKLLNNIIQDLLKVPMNKGEGSGEVHITIGKDDGDVDGEPMDPMSTEGMLEGEMESPIDKPKKSHLGHSMHSKHKV
jgi:hypothetical protein